MAMPEGTFTDQLGTKPPMFKDSAGTSWSTRRCQVGGSGPFAETPDDTPPVPILISTPRGQLDLVTSEPLGLPSTPIQKCILLCSLARSGSGAALTSLGLACCQEAVLRHG